MHRWAWVNGRAWFGRRTWVDRGAWVNGRAWVHGRAWFWGRAWVDRGAWVHLAAYAFHACGMLTNVPLVTIVESIDIWTAFFAWCTTSFNLGFGAHSALAT
jgi:hypothetical protein